MDPLKAKIRKLVEDGNANTFDGVKRPADVEEKINGLCRTQLNGPAGDALMNYLKSITTNVVMPAGTPSEILHRREGMREVIAILDARRNSTPK